MLQRAFCSVVGYHVKHRWVVLQNESTPLDRQCNPDRTLLVLEANNGQEPHLKWN